MYPSNANNCSDSEIWLENGSEEEYGCHKAHFVNNLRVKVCIFCDQRKPALLEEQAFSVILENSELLEKVGSNLCHLPHRTCWLIGRALSANLLSQAWKLAGCVPDYEEARPSWFDVDQSMTTVLSRIRLYSRVNQILKPYMTSGSAGIDKILHYLSNVDSTYEDFWFQMISAMRKLKTETDNEDLESLSGIISADKNNVVLMKATELTGKANCHVFDSQEYESMKQLQRLNKRFACPIVFKPTAIGLYNPTSRKIPRLLDDIDSEVISDVYIYKRAFSVGDIDKLERVLSTCNNLSSINLQQNSTTDEVREGFAPAVSRLLSNHHKLQKIALAGFNLAGTFARYPLPPVDNLQLRRCTFTDEDLLFMANRSDLDLKNLVITSYTNFHGPSLSIFIQNQAKSLKIVEFEYPTVSLAEICELLRIMAKFDKLQVFTLYCLNEIDFVSVEEIIVDLMSLHSIRKFYIDIPTTFHESGFDAERNHLNDVMKELCKIYQRPPIQLSLKMRKQLW